MGNDIIKCCTQTLTTEEDEGEDSDSNTALSETAKFLHEMKESKSNQYKHLDVPYTNDLERRSKKSVSTIKRREKRSMSQEDEVNATQIRLRQQRNAIKLLKKQNEFLRKQNEEFISKFGSFFQSYPTTETSINSLHSQYSISSMIDTPNIDNLCEISPISTSNNTIIEAQTNTKQIDLNIATSMNTDQITKNVSNISPSSPLTALTNNQTNIILSFSNISFPDTPNTSNATNNNNNTRASFCSLPILNDSNKEEIVDLYGHNDECIDIGSCQSFKRIVIALQWYSICDGDDDVLLQKIMDNKYDKYLVDDYQHIINHHSIEQYEMNINKQIEPCHIKTCNGYKRYHQLSNVNISISQNKAFCIDFMDLIHCYSMHSEHLQ